MCKDGPLIMLFGGVTSFLWILCVFFVEFTTVINFIDKLSGFEVYNTLTRCSTESNFADGAFHLPIVILDLP